MLRKPSFNGFYISRVWLVDQNVWRQWLRAQGLPASQRHTDPKLYRKGQVGRRWRHKEDEVDQRPKTSEDIRWAQTPVISRVKTSISWVKSPQLPIYLRPFIGAILPPSINSRSPPCTLPETNSHTPLFSQEKIPQFWNFIDSNHWFPGALCWCQVFFEGSRGPLRSRFAPRWMALNAW